MADAGKRLNVVPGLFSGVSRETEQALGEARQAASARGDFEAVERSFLTTPEERAEYDAAKAERRILKRLPTLPAPELGDALKGVTDLRAARNGKVPTLDQVKAARATQLLTGNPGDLTATDQVLFGKTPPASQRRIVSQPVPPAVDEKGLPGLPTGEKRFYSVDPATGEAMPVDLAGGTKPGTYKSPMAVREAFRAGAFGEGPTARAKARELIAQFEQQAQ